MKEKNKLLNGDIRADKVQLITDDGENKGEMSLSEALNLANKEGLDLMQIAQKGDTAIVKLLDYGKYLYQKKKQEQKNKQKSKSPEMKTLKITYKIGEHDLMIRKKQAEKFASNSHPLKVLLTLRGRENHYEDMAREKMEQFVSLVSEVYDLEKKIQKNGSNFIAFLKVKK